MSDTPVTSAPAPESTSSESAEITSAPEAKSEPRKYRLKVDGQEWEADENEVQKWAQIGRAKEKRFEESAKVRKEAESRMERLKSDWVSVLKEQGISRDQIEKYLGDELRRDMMSPEEKASFEKDQENKSLKEKLAEIESQKEQESLAREQRHYEAHLEAEIPKALEASNLPRSPATLRRIAGHLLQALEGGYDMSVAEAAELTKMELKQDLSHLLSVAGKFDDLIPPTVAEKLMHDHLAKVKSAPAFKQQSTDGNTGKPAPTKQYITPAEWKKQFGI